jgi:hypothetical protein
MFRFPHRKMRIVQALALVLLAVGQVLSAAQLRTNTAPLPDPQGFIAEVRKRLVSDRTLQSQYTYLEHREEISVSKLGKVSSGPLKVYEVYPSVEFGNNYKRLISINGVPLSAAELDKQDRVHREDVLREVEKRQHETPEQRNQRLRKEAEDRREEQATIDEAFALYTITMIGRETIRSHDTIVATLIPKPNFKPRSDAGKFLKKFKATAWVSESDYQLVRLEAEAIDDVTIGWGLIGRIHEGARAVFERTKVNGEVWLPSRTTFTGTGRALLFRTFEVNSVTTYSDYKKFSVKTDETFHEHETP